MSVDLGSRYISMSQHFLNRTQVGPIFQQMGGKGMPQGMGVTSLVNSALLA